MKSEWSHFIDAEDITTTEIKKVISASPQERKDLAQRFDVPAINKAEATLYIVRQDGSHIIHLRGQMNADICQICVVTGEEIISHVDENFEAWYEDGQDVVSLEKVRRERLSRGMDNEIKMPEEHDEPEPVVDGKIDVGELASQYLSLSIEPYPYKEGLTLSEDQKKALASETELRKNPFAALKDWKAERKKED